MTDLHTFSALYKSLLTSRHEAHRRHLLKKMLQAIPEEETIPFLQIVSGFKKPSLVTIKKLINWCTYYKGLPAWMLTTCHSITGDWVETLSLILGNPDPPPASFDSIIMILKKIDSFRVSKNEDELKSWLLIEWRQRSSDELYLIFKLLNGNLKGIVSKQIISELLLELYGTESLLLRYRLNELQSSEMTFEQLIKHSWSEDELKSKPYPFTEPEVIELSSFHFGDMEDWIVESFLNGTRIQIHQLASGLKISTEDQDLIQHDELECIRELNLLPVDTVIEVLIAGETYKDYFILDVHRWNEKEKNQLGTLINRKEIISTWLHRFQIINLHLIPHKVLSYFRNDVQQDNKENKIIKNIHDERRYRTKPEAITLNTALMYAEYINQNTSMQYIVTLGVYNHEMQLIPLTRVSADQMADTDKNELNYWIQNNTIQKFGPVRVVRSGKIICIEYDRVQKNKRVKSGIALVNVKVLKILNQSTGSKSVSSINEIIRPPSEGDHHV